jgi:hypothetical protein
VTVHQLQRDFTGAVRYANRRYQGNCHGPVLSVAFSYSGSQMAFGGYDKTVALIDTSVWAEFCKLDLEGTINTIAFDHFDRYIAVGCRDSSMTIFDSSTYIGIKMFQTREWVTDLSWKPTNGAGGDILAIRSKRHLISILNLQPIELTNTCLYSRDGLDFPSRGTQMGAFLSVRLGRMFLWWWTRTKILNKLRRLLSQELSTRFFFAWLTVCRIGLLLSMAAAS